MRINTPIWLVKIKIREGQGIQTYRSTHVGDERVSTPISEEYELCLMSPGRPMEPNKLYLSIEAGQLYYQCIDPEGKHIPKTRLHTDGYTPRRIDKLLKEDDIEGQHALIREARQRMLENLDLKPDFIPPQYKMQPLTQKTLKMLDKRAILKITSERGHTILTTGPIAILTQL